jgi:hypothetical protein
MPRVTVVKHAQQRYATKPVLDENGQQKTTVVMKNGAPRVKKSGTEVVRHLTVRDLDKPLPMPVCDFPNCQHESRTIAVGESYKFIVTRPGGRGKRHHYRHVDHPAWQYWEYSYSTAAQIARAQADMGSAVDSWDGTGWDDMVSELEGMAQEVADERREAVDNMPEALQDGSQAAEYADACESWVEEFSNLAEPDGGPGEEVDCEDCNGTGKNVEDCSACDSGKVECDECDGTGVSDGEQCGTCDGEGETDCQECDGSGDVEDDCQECDGTGSVTSDDPSDDYLDEARSALHDAVNALAL